MSPNTVFTNTLAKLSISDISLARSLLKHDDRDSDAYSKDRLKVVRRGEHSPDILPLHQKSVPIDIHIKAEEALRKLQQDAETWKELTKDMSDMQRTLFARDTLPNPEDRQIIKEVDSALGLNLYLGSAPSKLKRKCMAATTHRVTLTCRRSHQKRKETCQKPSPYQAPVNI